MATPHEETITELLQAWRDGDANALEKLVLLLYDDLHRMAQIALRKERSNHTLQTTEIVDELFTHLARQNRVELKNRNHFMAFSSMLMRRILVNYARNHNAGKRGGKAIKLSLDEIDAQVDARSIELMALDEALDRFEEDYPRQAQVVIYKFYGGLSVEQIAESLNVNRATVVRDWNFAKAWFQRELSQEE